MNKVINGEVVELSPEEEAEILAEWAANETAQLAQDLAQAKKEQKERLIREKLESMLVSEFSEIEAATDKAAINAVGLK